jgi:prepilin-type N-terminal cleavage/methylation domain-containing protein
MYLKNKILTNLEGFTLIELLVVIAIIAIISALSGVGIQNAFEGARDAQRRSDLKQYQTSLERVANAKNGFYPVRKISSYSTGYPASDLNFESGSLCLDLGLDLSNSITDCPPDPRYKKDATNWLYYRYISDDGNDTNGSFTAISYILWARLENVSTTTYWEVCSNGRSGTVTTLPVDSTCDL